METERSVQHSQVLSMWMVRNMIIFYDVGFVNKSPIPPPPPQAGERTFVGCSRLRVNAIKACDIRTKYFIWIRMNDLLAVLIRAVRNVKAHHSFKFLKPYVTAQILIETRTLFCEV